MNDAPRLSTAEARLSLGLSRTSLWKWYGDCRVATTGATRGPSIMWDRVALEARRVQLQKRSRAKRAS